MLTDAGRDYMEQLGASIERDLLMQPTIEHVERYVGSLWGAPVRFEGEERRSWTEWFAERDALPPEEWPALIERRRAARRLAP